MQTKWDKKGGARADEIRRLEGTKGKIMLLHT